MRRLTFLTLFVCLLYNCTNKQNNNIENKLEPIVLIYNKVCSQLPAPKIPTDGTLSNIDMDAFEIYNDSKKIIENEYVISFLEKNVYSKYLSSTFSNFSIDRKNVTEQKLSFLKTTELKDSKGNNVQVIDSLSFNKIESLKKASEIYGGIYYSPIYFLDKNTKAILFVSVYRHGLDSSVKVYYLEKKHENQNWIIKNKRTLSIS